LKSLILGLFSFYSMPNGSFNLKWLVRNSVRKIFTKIYEPERVQLLDNELV